MAITRQQALTLKRGDELHETGKFNHDGTCKRWRVSGRVKTFKRASNADRINIPIKHGMYAFDTITGPAGLEMFHLPDDATCIQCRIAATPSPRMTVGAVLLSKQGLGTAPVPRRQWGGAPPSVCDLCRKPFNHDTFVDGATVMGPWAMMCLACHGVYGVGLGTGRGQRYEREGARWYKVEG